MTAPATSDGLWTSSWRWIVQNVPQVIVITAISAAGAFLVNAVLMAWLYEGNQGISSQAPVAGGGPLGSATGMIFYALASSIVFGLVAYRRAVGAERFWYELRHLPSTVAAMVRSDATLAPVHALWGAAVALLFAAVLGPAVSGATAVAIGVTLPTLIGGVVLSLARRIWMSVASSFKPAGAAPPSIAAPAVAGIGIAAALLASILVPWTWAKVFIAVVAAGVAFLLSQNAKGGGAPPAMLWVLVAAIGAALVVILGGDGAAFADDGGWQECGSNLADWLSCPGSDGVIKDSVLAALAAGVPAAALQGVISSLVSGLTSSSPPSWVTSLGPTPTAVDWSNPDDVLSHGALDELDRLTQQASIIEEADTTDVPFDEEDPDWSQAPTEGGDLGGDLGGALDDLDGTGIPGSDTDTIGGDLGDALGDQSGTTPPGADLADALDDDGTGIPGSDTDTIGGDLGDALDGLDDLDDVLDDLDDGIDDLFPDDDLEDLDDVLGDIGDGIDDFDDITIGDGDGGTTDAVGAGASDGVTSAGGDGSTPPPPPPPQDTGERRTVFVILTGQDAIDFRDRPPNAPVDLPDDQQWDLHASGDDLLIREGYRGPQGDLVSVGIWGTDANGDPFYGVEVEVGGGTVEGGTDTDSGDSGDYDQTDGGGGGDDDQTDGGDRGDNDQTDGGDRGDNEQTDGGDQDDQTGGGDDDQTGGGGDDDQTDGGDQDDQTGGGGDQDDQTGSGDRGDDEQTGEGDRDDEQTGGDLGETIGEGDRDDEQTGGDLGETIGEGDRDDEQTGGDLGETIGEGDRDDEQTGGDLGETIGEGDRDDEQTGGDLGETIGEGDRDDEQTGGDLGETIGEGDRDDEQTGGDLGETIGEGDRDDEQTGGDLGETIGEGDRDDEQTGGDLGETIGEGDRDDEQTGGDLGETIGEGDRDDEQTGGGGEGGDLDEGRDETGGSEDDEADDQQGSEDEDEGSDGGDEEEDEGDDERDQTPPGPKNLLPDAAHTILGEESAQEVENLLRSNEPGSATVPLPRNGTVLTQIDPTGFGVEMDVTFTGATKGSDGGVDVGLQVGSHLRLPVHVDVQDGHLTATMPGGDNILSNTVNEAVRDQLQTLNNQLDSTGRAVKSVSVSSDGKISIVVEKR